MFSSFFSYCYSSSSSSPLILHGNACRLICFFTSICSLPIISAPNIKRSIHPISPVNRRRSTSRCLDRLPEGSSSSQHARSYCRGGGRRLEGKVAGITEGASGLGRATAHEFIQNGAQVIIADIDSSLGPQVAKDLGPSTHFVKCDVAEEAQIKKVVEIAISRHGKLDIMYNNTEITGPSFPPSIADLDLVLLWE